MGPRDEMEGGTRGIFNVRRTQPAIAGFEEGERGTPGEAYSSLTKLGIAPSIFSSKNTGTLVLQLQGMEHAANNPIEQETHSPPGPPERNAACQPLDFCPVRLVPDF